MLDGSDFAQRWDLPELARFMLGDRAAAGRGARGSRGLTSTWTADVVRSSGRCIRVKGEGLRAQRLKSRASDRVLMLPSWCVGMLRTRRVRLGAFEGPVFPDAGVAVATGATSGARFVGCGADTDFEWVKPHTYRKTVATMLDESGASARDDRGPAGPLAGVDDPGRLPGPAGSQLGNLAGAEGLRSGPISRLHGDRTVPGMSEHSSPHSSPSGCSWLPHRRGVR